MYLFPFQSFLTIPHDSHLSDVEKGKIDAYKDIGLSIRQIVEKINRSSKVVWRYLKNPFGYGQKKRPGRPRKLSAREDRRIYRAASNTVTSLARTKESLHIYVCKTSIWNSLKRGGTIVCRKMAPAPKFTADHLRKRLQFARYDAARVTDWTKVSSFFHSGLTTSSGYLE